ncbi:MAG: hypothetical protein ABIJ86_17375 [Spirochaetota bacterium]
MNTRTVRDIAIPVAFVLILAALSFAFTGCEKRDLAFGEVLPNSCSVCHGSEPEYNLASARAGYEWSVHNLGGNSFYSNGGGCQKCHTSEGFVKFLKTGMVDTEGYEATPSQQSCFTCHDPHGKGTFVLRVTETVKLANSEMFSGGKGNVCANCHQARVVAADVVVEMEASKVSSRFGPHHSPQGDIFAGTNAFEFPGKTYDGLAHAGKITDSCVTCHKSQPEGRFALSPAVGGHSFNIVGEVHEAEVLNVAGCLSCHPGVTQIARTTTFSRLALADYDNDGAIEPFQTEFEGLISLLMNEEGTGYLQSTIDPPFYAKNGAWMPARTGMRTVAQMAALYNYSFFVEDRSRGIHNPAYSIQVLYDTISNIDPSFNVSNRPRGK